MEKIVFTKIQEKHRKKYLLNVFLYYPLALVLSVVTATIILKFVGIEIPFTLLLIAIVFLIFVGVLNLMKIYNQLIEKKEE